MKTIAVIIDEGYEEIEFVNVVDILRRAECVVDVLSARDSRVTGAHHITIECDDIFNYDNTLNYDGVVFVGGMNNAVSLAQNNDVLKLINYYVLSNKLVGCICASPAFILPNTNLPDGTNITCYPVESLKENFTGRFNFVDSKVCVEGNLITSQSPSTAMEFALAILTYLGYDADKIKNDLQGEQS